MGSSTSKPETKVFTPTTPIDFSASFLSQLENSPESDYSRAQHTEKYIQERVAEELTKLEKQSIKNFQQTTNAALIPIDEKPEFSVPAANEKIAKLTELLKSNANLAKIEIPEAVVAAKDEVINCLKSNAGKSLNCWDEIESFRNLTKDL
ncbi:uncharacterized protein RJT21DRAFT_118413 [Scheffersomyces amazonensis]|uniref:uncharacterized protein n=1 Tax=Scheffersomyces amazonensis TaxID=1078765 RepID=UPI00315D0D4E